MLVVLKLCNYNVCCSFESAEYLTSIYRISFLVPTFKVSKNFEHQETYDGSLKIAYHKQLQIRSKDPTLNFVILNGTEEGYLVVRIYQIFTYGQRSVRCSIPRNHKCLVIP